MRVLAAGTARQAPAAAVAPATAAAPARAEAPGVRETLRAPGTALDPETRASLEARFGHDFGRVRVHAGGEAGESARGLRARGYALGHHVVLRDGYRPDTAAGRRVLAHELAHVAQQADGGAGTPGPGEEARAEGEARRAAARVEAGLDAGPVGRAPVHLALDGDEPAPAENVVIVASLASGQIEFRSSRGTQRYRLRQQGLRPGVYQAQVSVEPNRVSLLIRQDTPMSGQWAWVVGAGQTAPDALLRGATTARIEVTADALPPVAQGAPAPPPGPEQDPRNVVLSPEEAQRRCEAGNLPVMTFPLRFTRFNESYVIATREGGRIRVRMPVSSYANGRQLPGMHDMPPPSVTSGVLLEPNELVRVRLYTPRLNPFADDQVTESCRTGEQMLDVSAQGDRAILVNAALTGVDALMFTPVGAAINRGISAAATAATRRVVAPGLAAAMIGTARVAEPALLGGASRAAVTAVEQRAGAAVVETAASRALAQGTAEVGASAVARGTAGVAVAGVSRGVGATVARGGAGVVASGLGRVVRNAVAERGMRPPIPAGGQGALGPGGNAPSDIPHVVQSQDVSCGPACGEMASGHHARTIPGSRAANEAVLIAQPEYHAGSGMDPFELAEMLERETPVVGRAWQSHNFIAARRPTVDDIRLGLEAALRDGNGVAIVQVHVTRQGSTYSHWVVVREVRGAQVLVHDPEAASASLELITSEGFGEYYCSGDAVLALVRR